MWLKGSYRKYGHHDHFMRVAFMDEDKQTYYWSSDINWSQFLETRVGNVLRSGLMLAGRYAAAICYGDFQFANKDVLQTLRLSRLQHVISSQSLNMVLHAV